MVSQPTLWLRLVDDPESQDAIDAIVDHRRIAENGMLVW